MENMTAKVSCFARAYHYKNNDCYVFKDGMAEKLLGEHDYQMVAENMAQGIAFFAPGFRGTKEEALRFIVDTQLSPSVLARSAFCARMSECGFDNAKKTFGSLLGISYYLTKEDFQRLTSTISGLMPEGSAICMDYPLVDTGAESEKNRELAGVANEQMKARYNYNEMEQLLAAAGFRIYEHQDAKEMTKQYFGDYNSNNPEHIMKAPGGVGYLLAVKK